VARKNDLASSIGRYLKKNEKVIGASRATPRRSVVTTALLAGIGAAGGYILSAFIGDGGLAAALGGGAGALAGIVIAAWVAYFRMRRNMGIRASVVTMALTSGRLLLFRQSWLSNRATELTMEISLGSITSIVVGRSRFLTPHPLTVTLSNEAVMKFESAKIEEPERLAQAFLEATGG